LRNGFKPPYPINAIKSDYFEVTGYCLPADQVGGDYFDYFFSK